MSEEVNVCCSLLYLADCADTEEHKHAVCTSKSVIDGSPILDNEHVGTYCFSEQFKNCPYYPRGG